MRYVREAQGRQKMVGWFAGGAKQWQGSEELSTFEE